MNSPIFVYEDTDWSEISPNINDYISILDGAELTLDVPGRCHMIDIYEGNLIFDLPDTTVEEPSLMFKGTDSLILEELSGFWLREGGILTMDPNSHTIASERKASRDTVSTFVYGWNIRLSSGFMPEHFDLPGRNDFMYYGMIPSISYYQQGWISIPLLGVTKIEGELGIDLYKNTLENGSEYFAEFDRVSERPWKIEGAFDMHMELQGMYAGKYLLNILRSLADRYQSEYPLMISCGDFIEYVRIKSLKHRIDNHFIEYEMVVEEVKRGETY